MSDYGCTESAVAADFEKDPDAIIDFAINWVALDDDEIATSVFSLPDGLTEVSSSFEGAVTQIFVSGGSAGASYRITNRITTTGGRTLDKTIRVLVREM